MAASICLALGGLSLLVPSAPTTDPWGWIVWGREIVHGGLDTIVPGAPSWKPLPVLATTPLALAGSSAPALWLALERAAGLASLVVAYRLAARLAGAWAGALAAIGLVLNANWVRELSHGYSEPFTIGLLLAAADAHLSGRRRTAIVLGGLVSLARPEALALVCLYGVVLWRRGERALLLLGGTVTCVLALWLVPDWIGSGDPLHASKVARAVEPGGLAADLHAFGGGAEIVALPLLALAVAAVAIAIRRRDRAVGELAALAGIWCALLTAMMLAGYPASARFFVLPMALLCVIGAAGAVRVVRMAGGRRARLAVAAVLVLAAMPSIALRASAAADAAGDSVDRARFEEALSATVRHAGFGSRSEEAPTLPAGLAWAKGAVAWELNLPLRDVRTAGRANERLVLLAPPGR